MEEEGKVGEVWVRGWGDDLHHEGTRVRDGGGALGLAEADEEEGDEAEGPCRDGWRGGVGCGYSVTSQGEDEGGEGRGAPREGDAHEPEGEVGWEEGVPGAGADKDVPVVVAEGPVSRIPNSAFEGGGGGGRGWGEHEGELRGRPSSGALDRCCPLAEGSSDKPVRSCEEVFLRRPRGESNRPYVYSENGRGSVRRREHDRFAPHAWPIREGQEVADRGLPVPLSLLLHAS